MGDAATGVVLTTPPAEGEGDATEADGSAAVVAAVCAMAAEDIIATSVTGNKQLNFIIFLIPFNEMIA